MLVPFDTSADHPAILPLWAAFQDRDFLCLVMQSTMGDLMNIAPLMDRSDRSIAKVGRNRSRRALCSIADEGNALRCLELGVCKHHTVLLNCLPCVIVRSTSWARS